MEAGNGAASRKINFEADLRKTDTLKDEVALMTNGAAEAGENHCIMRRTAGACKSLLVARLCHSARVVAPVVDEADVNQMSWREAMDHLPQSALEALRHVLDSYAVNRPWTPLTADLCLAMVITKTIESHLPSPDHLRVFDARHLVATKEITKISV